MNATQRIRLGLLLTNLKLGGRFSFRTFVNDKDYPKDPDPKNWRTINGSKVHLSNGKIDGGAGEKFKGNEWHGKVAHGSNSFFPPKGWVKPPPPPKEPPKVPEPDPFTPEVVSLPKKQAKVGLPGLGTHYANMLKGSYKNATHMVKGGVDDAFKQAGKMHSSTAQKGVFIDMLGLDNSSDAELAQKVFEAAKNKQITPLAAKNVMAALAAKKHSLVTNNLKKELGMSTAGSASAPAPQPTKAGESPNKYIAEGIIKQMEISGGGVGASLPILKAAGLTESEAFDVIDVYDYDAEEGKKYLTQLLDKTGGAPKKPAMTPTSSPVAKSATTTGEKTKNDIDLTEIKKISEHYEDMSDEKQESYQKKIANELGITKKQADYLLINLQMSDFTDEKAIGKIKEWNPAASLKIDLTKAKKISQHWDDMDEDDQSEYLQDLSGKFNIPTEKAALLMNLLQKPGFTDAKAEAKIKEWQKENGVPVGNKTIEKLASKPMQTPGLSSVDTSEKATGIKQAPGTLGLFKAGNYNDVDDPKWDNFTKYNKAQYDSLPAEEKASIKRYTEGSTHLRDYLVYGKVEGWGEYTKEALQKKVDNISNGLQKMKHPPMWVNRGASLMDWATADNPKGITKAQLKKMAKNGEVFTNDAFLSTNPTDKITYGSTSVIRRFYVPEEASGGYIASGSAYKNEKEFLLDKKTKTRIMKVEEVNGTIITYEEVIL